LENKKKLCHFFANVCSFNTGWLQEASLKLKVHLLLAVTNCFESPNQNFFLLLQISSVGEQLIACECAGDLLLQISSVGGAADCL
jgi:hypothetical protein